MFSDTCVILAAGRGTHMGTETPKVLLEVAGVPVIQHVINFWKEQGIEHFIFVVGYRKQLVMDYLESSLKWFEVVCQDEQRGIADAILKVREVVKDDNFIVALGDCLNIGSFEYPVSLDIGCGVWSNPYLNYERLSYGARVNSSGYIQRLKEKDPVTFAGMGTYFFNEAVFPYIEHSKPSKLRNEIEITDVLEWMIRDGHLLKAVPFLGEVINLTTPADIEYANKILNIGVRS